MEWPQSKYLAITGFYYEPNITPILQRILEGNLENQANVKADKFKNQELVDSKRNKQALIFQRAAEKPGCASTSNTD